MPPFLRAFLAEPRFPAAPRRTRWDWPVVGVLVVLAVVEGVFTDPLDWRVASTIASAAVAFLLVWRRTLPLVTVATAFVLGGVFYVVSELAVDDTTYLGSAGLTALILVYALCRWGSGREIALGMTIVLVVHVVTDAVDETAGIFESAIGSIIWLFAAAVGLIVRARANGRLRTIEEVRLREREQLARELHDTVAHHVSAIAIQAQAGRAVAATQPEFAASALASIEEQASRTLEEMRAMVSSLRDSEAALEPQRGIADIRRLAENGEGGPAVTVDLDGDLTGLPPSLEAGLFRLAQESVTNARRHARHASRLVVHIVGDPDAVTLHVSDDGDPVPRDPLRSPGFGLVGMTERAALLGGTLEAGPGPDRGWVVQAELPRGRMSP